MKTCIHSSVVATLLALGFSISSVNGGWSEVVLGEASGELLIGSGRNDGIIRMYCASGAEFSWVSNSWVYQGLANDGWGIALGMGRIDNLRRVYVAGNAYGNFENNYAASVWNTGLAFGGDGYDVELLAARNDGVNRLYYTNSGGEINECTWTQNTTSYSQLALPSSPEDVKQLTYGNGRNDGQSRFYGFTDSGILCEWSYNGAWSIATANLELGAMHGLAIGVARPDGVNRIYAACADGHIYELTWSGSAWNSTSVLGSGLLDMTCVVLGDPRGEGTTSVYAGSNDGRIYEFRNRTGVWEQNVLFQGLGGLQRLTVGPGRGDGVNRLYATDGTLREYTYTPTTSAPFAAQILPDGILEWSSTPGGVYDVEWSSDLTTWQSDWSSLSGIPATGTSTQKPIPRFFRVKQRTE